MIWNFSQPISDNMEEAVSGVKGELAVKLYGENLRTLEEKAAESRNVKLAALYHTEWAGEYESQKRANKRMALVIPITVLVIFLILCTMSRSFKWALLILVSVIMASIGGPLALFMTHTNFSVSSAVGFLRCSASRFKRASSCWSTSISCERSAREWKSLPKSISSRQPSKARSCDCVPS